MSRRCVLGTLALGTGTLLEGTARWCSSTHKGSEGGDDARKRPGHEHRAGGFVSHPGGARETRCHARM